MSEIKEMTFDEIQDYQKQLIHYVSSPEEYESPFHSNEGKIKFCRAMISLLETKIRAQYRAWEE